jgi:hypothetical protein
MNIKLVFLKSFKFSITRGFQIWLFLLLVSSTIFSCQNKSVEEINLENRVNALLTSLIDLDEKSENKMILDTLSVLKISINEIDIDVKNKEGLLHQLDKISFQIDSLDKVLYKKIEGVYSHFATDGYESAESMLNIIYDSSLNTLYGTWTFFSNNQPFMINSWSNGKIKIIKNNGDIILDYNPMLDASGKKESTIHRLIRSGQSKNPFIYKFIEENGSMKLLQHNVKDPEGKYNGLISTKINSPNRTSKTIEFYREMFK